jgi:hypothetical protein
MTRTLTFTQPKDSPFYQCKDFWILSREMSMAFGKKRLPKTLKIKVSTKPFKGATSLTKGHNPSFGHYWTINYLIHLPIEWVAEALNDMTGNAPVVYFKLV